MLALHTSGAGTKESQDAASTLGSAQQQRREGNLLRSERGGHAGPAMSQHCPRCAPPPAHLQLAPDAPTLPRFAPTMRARLLAALLLAAAACWAQPQAPRPQPRSPSPPPPPPTCRRPANCTTDPCSVPPYSLECASFGEACVPDYCDEAHGRCWARCVKPVSARVGQRRGPGKWQAVMQPALPPSVEHRAGVQAPQLQPLRPPACSRSCRRRRRRRRRPRRRRPLPLPETPAWARCVVYWLIV